MLVVVVVEHEKDKPLWQWKEVAEDLLRCCWSNRYREIAT